jgi:CHAT domain-containing protein
MDEFYANLLASQERDAVAAVAASQRKLIESGEHAYYWAPFSAIGGF